MTSIAFTSVLHREKIAISIDRKGAWRDDVFIERLWRSVNMRRFICRARARLRERVSDRADLARYPLASDLWGTSEIMKNSSNARSELASLCRFTLPGHRPTPLHTHLARPLLIPRRAIGREEMGDAQRRSFPGTWCGTRSALAADGRACVQHRQRLDPWVQRRRPSIFERRSPRSRTPQICGNASITGVLQSRGIGGTGACACLDDANKYRKPAYNVTEERVLAFKFAARCKPIFQGA